MQLIEMTRGVAAGMQYLSQMGYVHRVGLRFMTLHLITPIV